ncbi:MAG: hypothetical protein ACHRXM_26990 [Isosphaerales bacterium]
MQWGAGALIVLLVHCLVASRSAWAGCNHLISSRSDRLLEFNRLDAIVAGGSSSSFSDDLARDPLEEKGSKRPAPCSGPSCSSRVPLPLPAASQGPDGSDQWVVMNAVVPLAVVSPRCRTIDEPAARPAGHKPSIFHPPPA